MLKGLEEVNNYDRNRSETESYQGTMPSPTEMCHIGFANK